jgi:hypothetical protein
MRTSLGKKFSVLGAKNRTAKFFPSQIIAGLYRSGSGRFR